MGIKPTGKSYKVKDVDLFTFNDDGKITEHRSVQSSSTIMMQTGAKFTACKTLQSGKTRINNI